MSNTHHFTANKSVSFYSALTALRNAYPPEDDLGIPKLSETASRATEWSRDNSIADLPPQRKNTN